MASDNCNVPEREPRHHLVLGSLLRAGRAIDGLLERFDVVEDLTERWRFIVEEHAGGPHLLVVPFESVSEVAARHQADAARAAGVVVDLLAAEVDLLNAEYLVANGGVRARGGADRGVGVES